MSKSDDAAVAFAEHVLLWARYLEEVLVGANGDHSKVAKYQRQLEAVTDVLHAVPFSTSLFEQIIDLYTNDRAAEQSDCDCLVRDSYFYDEFQNPSAGRSAVDAALQADELFLIQGPPGTGKTSVISEIVLQTLRENPNARIVITSETHAAVDNALERILSKVDQSEHMVLRYPLARYGSPALTAVDFPATVRQFRQAIAAIDEKLACDVIENLKLTSVLETSDDDDRGIRNAFSHKLIAERAAVLGITCNQLARFRYYQDDPPFDLVIVDEVSKATLPEILIALSNTRKAVLVGDPMQLPPTFCREELEALERVGDVSLDELISQSVVDRLFAHAPKSKKAFLDTQFRMVDEIGTLVSKRFYEGRLRNGRQERRANAVAWIDYADQIRVPPKPVRQGGRLQNQREASLIKQEIATLERKLPPGTSIAVVTPYKHQKALLRRVLANSTFEQIEIDTIDAFQGREADVVFISLVRTTGSPRFYADSRRLNVAISRARNQVYFVGKFSYLKRVKFLASIRERILRPRR